MVSQSKFNIIRVSSRSTIIKKYYIKKKQKKKKKQKELLYNADLEMD